MTSCFVYSVTKIVVYAEAEPSVSGTYLPKPRTEVPEGFKDVCVENGWDVEATWVKLNGGGEDGAWYKKEEIGATSITTRWTGPGGSTGRTGWGCTRASGLIGRRWG